MGLKKVLIIVICIVASVLFLVGCFRVFYIKHQYELDMQFDDTNGDDKSVVGITDDMINRHFEDYRAIKRSVQVKADNEIRITGKYEDCDRSYIKTEIGMLSGIYVSNAFLGTGKYVTYAIESSVEAGNLRVIITDYDCNILYDIPIDQSYTLTFLAEEGESYYVKFIGESAKLNVTIERHEE